MTQSRTERIDKWVRGRLADAVVVETRDPLLVWQGGFPPVYGFAREEVAEGALRPASAAAYDGGFFFGPHLPVAQWYDVVSGDDVLECGRGRSRTCRPGDADVGAGAAVVDRGRRDRGRAPARPAQAGRDTAELSPRVSDDRRRGGRRERSSGAAAGDSPAHALLPAARGRAARPAECDRQRLDMPVQGHHLAYWSFTGPPEVRNVAWSYAQPLPAVAAIADGSRSTTSWSTCAWTACSSSGRCRSSERSSNVRA